MNSLAYISVVGHAVSGSFSCKVNNHVACHFYSCVVITKVTRLHPHQYSTIRNATEFPQK